MNKITLQQLQQYDEQRFTKRIAFKEKQNVIFVLNFLPGQQLPTHQHPGANVYLLGLEGEGEVIVEGTATPLLQGEIAYVDGDAQFAYRNTGSSPASLYVVLTQTPSEEYARPL